MKGARHDRTWRTTHEDAERTSGESTINQIGAIHGIVSWQALGLFGFFHICYTTFSPRIHNNAIATHAVPPTCDQARSYSQLNMVSTTNTSQALAEPRIRPTSTGNWALRISKASNRSNNFSASTTSTTKRGRSRIVSSN